MSVGQIHPLRERVAFDRPTKTDNGYGGETVGWDTANAIKRSAAFIYQRGREASRHGKATGTAVIKVKIHQSTAAQAITTDWRMRDTRRNIQFDIVEVDRFTDRRWIWLVVEGGEGLEQ